MLKIFISTITIISLFILVILLNTTTPVVAGPFGILSIFISAYIVLIGILAYFLYYTSYWVARLAKSFMPRKPIRALVLRRSYYYSTVIAAAPIMLIGLQSVGRIGFYEISLMLIFVCIGCLYVSKKVN